MFLFTCAATNENYTYLHTLALHVSRPNFVEEQHQQDAVVDADRELRVARELGEGSLGHDHQRHLHRALALHAHQQSDRLPGRQVEQEVRVAVARSEEHPSELQSLMSISSAVFCLYTNNTCECCLTP